MTFQDLRERIPEPITEAQWHAILEQMQHLIASLNAEANESVTQALSDLSAAHARIAELEAQLEQR